jgi:hyperosmotically inducible periplasmic protein
MPGTLSMLRDCRRPLGAAETRGLTKGVLMTSKSLSVVCAASCVVLLIGCDRSKESSADNHSTAPRRTTDSTRADNTERNKGDQSADVRTPMDQSNSADDIKVTADVRRAIMDDKSMSVNGQNCKIITDKSGVVTLRGPVASQMEKDSIEAKAKAVAGVNRVVNELEVKAD